MQIVERHFLDKVGEVVPQANEIDDEAFAELVMPDVDIAKRREGLEIHIAKLLEARDLLK